MFFGANADQGGQPVKVHWGYPDPSKAEGGEEGKRRAFELTRQAIGYRMLQLLALPLDTMDRATLRRLGLLAPDQGASISSAVSAVVQRPAAGLIVINGRRASAAQTSGMDMRREHRRLLP